MTTAADRQRWLTCWSVSVFLHASLLIFGEVWLIHPARFNVRAGKTSMEIDLVIEPIPVPAGTASAPKQPTQPAPPQRVPTAPIPAPMKTEIRANPQPLKFPVPLKVSQVKETSSSSQGALQAQPDELHNEPPEYPEESRIAREQGVVILQVEVTAEGEPASVSILQSSGYFRLDQAARRAVLHWKFHPAMTAGVPVSSEADVPVHFKLQ